MDNAVLRVDRKHPAGGCVSQLGQRLIQHPLGFLRVLQVHIVVVLETFIGAVAIADRQVLAAISVDVGEVQQAVLPNQMIRVGFAVAQRYVTGRGLQLLENFEGVFVAHGNQCRCRLIQRFGHFGE